MLTTSQRVAVETSFIYDVELDRFISNDGSVYTCEEMDALDRMEADWKDSLPYYSFYDWVKVFEDEKPAIAKALRGKVDTLKEWVRSFEDGFELDKGLLQDAYTRNQTPEGFKQTQRRIALLEQIMHEKRELLNKEIGITISRINYLTGKPNTSGRITDEIISRAKSVPIASLIKVGRDHKALCPFHSDTKPSLHVYKDNHAYCFVCTKSASVIDIYMALHSCDFRTAVKALAV